MNIKHIVFVLLAAINMSSHADNHLAIYSWDDYFGETTISDFEQLTKNRVLYDTFPSADVLETKLLLGHSGYDVVFPSASIAERAYQAGALRAIDVSKLKNYRNLGADYLAWLKKYQGGQLLGVPYTWGTVGIAYNTKMIKKRMATAPVNSLDIVFNPSIAAKFKDCGIALLDSPLEMLSVALNYLGLDPNSAKEADLQRAEALLLATQKNIRYFDSTRPINDLSSGDICLAITYSGDAGTAGLRATEAGNGVDIAYAIPQQGTLVWMDLMAIPKDAANSDRAYAFIDFILRPDVIAGVTNHLTYANPNSLSLKLIDPTLANDKNIFPDAATKARLFPDVALSSDNVALRNRVWTRVKTGH